jgi:phosphatidylglycerol---prolipoprotein diacylglyceryl transferase
VEFPVWIQLGGLRLHPHVVFETLGYAFGFQTYRLLRKRSVDPISSDHRWYLIVAAAFGAVVGSKVLYWLSDPVTVWNARSDLAVVVGGKTIVGGLIGGWIAIEALKRQLGIHASSGDLFALPLALGIAIGRIGCFLTGLPDNTHGDPTSLPWGLDYGDGILRHPTQLYEILFLAALITVLRLVSLRPHRDGDVFRLFMAGYAAWRLALGFIQPGFAILGLTAIQWSCLFVLVFYADQLPRLIRTAEATPTA